HRALVDARLLVEVGVDAAHGGSGGHAARERLQQVRRERDVAAAQPQQALAVGLAHAPDGAAGTADDDRLVGDGGSRRQERPFSEDAAASQAGAREQDRSIADLAEVADGGADPPAAMAEDDPPPAGGGALCGAE